MGWWYTLQREAIPLDRQDLRLVKDGADASLPPTNIATSIGVGDARVNHDALADGPISTLHTQFPHFFTESSFSSLTQPPVTLNVTTSLKSCSDSSNSCTVM